jgi:hypothetical protein
MMTKQQVSDRIEKKHQDIEKINRRITKWSKTLSAKDIEMAKEYGMMDYENPLKKEARQKLNDYIKVNFPNSGYTSDINEWANAYNDLREAEVTLAKYEVQMTEIVNFEKEDKIQVLVDFLNDWREKAFQWYMNNAQEYIALRKIEEEEFNKYLKNEEEKAGQQIQPGRRYSYHRFFREEYYRSITSTAMEIAGYNSIDTAKLNKMLDDEVIQKYKDLVLRITKVVGEIQDVSNLSIGKNGDINGVVTGSIGKAKVETISAGGYNIQVFHYRVLVHEVK